MFGRSPVACGWLAAVCLVSIHLASAVRSAAGITVGVPAQVGTNSSAALPEVSGVAVSRAIPNTFWVHNDHGDTARFFAMSTQGNLLGTFPLAGAMATDWEDIAIGPKPGGGNYLYLGDIGDNDGNHASVSIYRLDEPQSSVSATIAATQYSQAVLQYEDGSHDAESLFVDPITSDMYIISKSTSPAIYRVSASAFDAPPHVTVVPMVGSLGAPLPNPTAADISPDGRHILVRSKASIGYLFERSPGQSIVEALLDPGIPISLASEVQGEAIGWAADGSGFYTTSERKNSPVPIYYYSFSVPEPTTLMLIFIGALYANAMRERRH